MWNGQRRKVMRKKSNITFDSFQLKVVAALAMLCSHIYKCLLVTRKEFLFLDIIGRIAFPVFCFVLVEGYCHTHSRKAYLMRLWVGAVLSEIPFNLAFFGHLYAPEEQNVLFTMLIGMLTLMGMDKCRDCWKVIPVLAGMVLAWLCKADYGYYGIGIIVLFYYLRGMKKELITIQAGCSVAATVLYGWVQFLSVLALPFIAAYNGEKGKNHKILFYLFYPVHLMALTLIRFAVN